MLLHEENAAVLLGAQRPTQGGLAQDKLSDLAVTAG
jgi:hypothetical protein